MKDEVFVYKCPSCGGKVDYIDNKWHCSYCNNTYNSLFAANNEIELPDYKNIKTNLYGYTCKKCNRKFVSTLSSGATCIHCNEVTEEQGTLFVASNIMDLSVTSNDALNSFREEISDYSSDRNLFCEEPKLQYINCDLYNGFIKLSYNGYTMKYIFVNLLVPNIDYEDYRFMYEVGNNGFKYSTASTNNKETLVEKIIQNGEYLNSFNDKNYEEDLVNECIDDFLSKVYVKDKQLIEIDKRMKIDDGYYVPFYISNSSDNNYHHYVFGNDQMSIIKKNFFGRVRYSKTIVELKEEKSAHSRIKRYNVLSKVFNKISYFLFYVNASIVLAMLESSGVQSATSYIVYIIFGIAMILFLLSLGIYTIFYNKYNYYEKTIRLSKKEYLNQIINNSNCVKIIEERK